VRLLGLVCQQVQLNTWSSLAAAGEVLMLAAAVAQEDIGHRFLENLLVGERLLNQYSR